MNDIDLDGIEARIDLAATTDDDVLLLVAYVRDLRRQLEAATAERDTWHEAYDRQSEEIRQANSDLDEWRPLAAHVLCADNGDELERANVRLRNERDSSRQQVAGARMALQLAQVELESYLESQWEQGWIGDWKDEHDWNDFLKLIKSDRMDLDGNEKNPTVITYRRVCAALAKGENP